jgi:hypothetical protein
MQSAAAEEAAEAAPWDRVVPEKAWRIRRSYQNSDCPVHFKLKSRMSVRRSPTHHDPKKMAGRHDLDSRTTLLLVCLFDQPCRDLRLRVERKPK